MGRDDHVVLREPATGTGRDSDTSADVPFRDRGRDDLWPGVVGGVCHVGLLASGEAVPPLTNKITGRGVNSEANRRKEIMRESLHRIYIHSLGRM